MNHEEKLLRFVGEISELDEDAMKKTKKRQDSLTKVPGSLGRLKEISIKMAGITGKVTGNSLKKQCIALFCSDNGVVFKGIASSLDRKSVV